MNKETKTTEAKKHNYILKPFGTSVGCVSQYRCEELQIQVLDDPLKQVTHINQPACFGGSYILDDDDYLNFDGDLISYILNKRNKLPPPPTTTEEEESPDSKPPTFNVKGQCKKTGRVFCVVRVTDEPILGFKLEAISLKNPTIWEFVEEAEEYVYKANKLYPNIEFFWDYAS